MKRQSAEFSKTGLIQAKLNVKNYSSQQNYPIMVSIAFLNWKKKQLFRSCSLSLFSKRQSPRIRWKKFEKIIGWFEFVVRWFVSDSRPVWFSWIGDRATASSKRWHHSGFNHWSRCRMESAYNKSSTLIFSINDCNFFFFFLVHRNSKSLLVLVLSKALAYQISINVKFNVFWIMQPLSRYLCKSNCMSTYSKMSWWTFVKKRILS